MTALTTKQRAKVNAALCIIHDNGFDAQAVTNMASAHIAIGHDARVSYELALNSFVRDNPEAGPAIYKMTQLVEASSMGTIAQYDKALSDYIETGDNSGLVALAPTIAEDSIALAIHNGEITEAEAAKGGVSAALGFEAGSLLQPAPEPVEASAVISDAPLPFADTRSQLSLTRGAGYVGRKAQAAPVHYCGFAPDAPAVSGLTAKSAQEAARVASSTVGMVFLATPEGYP